MKPVFLNDKTFPIQVGTPSGTGRIINPGFAVEGDYFSSSVAGGTPLRRLGTEEAKVFDKQKILVSLDHTSAGMLPEVTKPYAAPPAPEPDPETEAVVKAAPDATNKTMEETLGQAMKEMGTQIPTLAELKKMNMDQLNAAAVKYGISKASGRADIINQLAARLSL